MQTNPNRTSRNSAGMSNTSCHSAQDRIGSLLNVVGRLAIATAVFGLFRPSGAVEGATMLKSICRVKGQEENTLIGEGIVVGLKGTGEGGSSPATALIIARVMSRMGSPVSEDAVTELKDAKNVARVFVTATVPAAGARQGDKIDCVVSAPSAKSLAGGRLFMTALVGPENPGNPRVYAFAEGPITLDDPEIPNTGRIHRGCRLEEDFDNVFTKNGKVTLVLDSNYADFQVAQGVADLINSEYDLRATGGRQALATALDQVNVEVEIPPQYRDYPVDFISRILGLPMPLGPQTGARVTINERAGSIIISGDVEIGAVVVTVKNIIVETGQTATTQFVPIAPDEAEASPKLKALVEALNAVQAPNKDIIHVIKGLARNGKLHAQLIIE